MTPGDANATRVLEEVAVSPRFQRSMSRIIRSLNEAVSLEFTLSPFRTLKKRFVVACSARTGSHLLCQGLNEFGGFAQEVFHVDRIRRMTERRGITSLQRYCQSTFNKSSVNGVYGVKGGIQVMAPLLLSREVPEYVSEWRFVFLTREDLVRQAISGYLASLTGAYKASKEPARRVVDADFDGASIARRAAANLATNEIWGEIFDYFQIEPYRVTYEDLAKDPKRIAAEAAAHIGLDGPPITEERLMSEPVELQATELNDRWAQRFRDEGWRIESKSEDAQ